MLQFPWWLGFEIDFLSTLRIKSYCKEANKQKGWGITYY